MSKTTPSEQYDDAYSFATLYEQHEQEVRALKDLIEELLPLLQAAQPDLTRKWRKQCLYLWKLSKRPEVHHTRHMRRYISQDGTLYWKYRFGSLWRFDETSWIDPRDIKIWREDLQKLKQRLQLEQSSSSPSP